MINQFLQSGVTYLTRVLINDFYKQLSLCKFNILNVLDILERQLVNKQYLGHLCTVMMFNELEIISWCYTMYLLLTYDEIKYHLEKDGKSHSEVKYCNRDELVLAAAIFAKVKYKFNNFQFACNNEDEEHANYVIGTLNLKKDLLINQFKSIEYLIDDAVAMDAFYLEMRLANDPTMLKHAEDYNLMVLEMVKGSQQRGISSSTNLGG